jgi:hypothetical protein
MVGLQREEFTEEYFNKLYEWYDSGGDRNVAAYLATLDISSFNPKKPPPKTAAFWAIVDANVAPEESELADVFDVLKNPDAATIQHLIVAADKNGLSGIATFLSDRKNRRAFPHRLEGCGYVPVRNNTKEGTWVINGKRQVIYVKKALSLHDKFRAAQALIKEAEMPVKAAIRARKGKQR